MRLDGYSNKRRNTVVKTAGTRAGALGNRRRETAGTRAGTYGNSGGAVGIRAGACGNRKGGTVRTRAGASGNSRGDGAAGRINVSGTRNGRTAATRKAINDSEKMKIMLAITIVLLCITGAAIYGLVASWRSADAAKVSSGMNLAQGNVGGLKEMAGGIVTLAQEQEDAARSGNSDILIVIDPGHGGYDNGSNVNGIYEQEITLDIALRLDEKLKKMGYATLLLREDNETHLFPEERVEMAEKAHADIFVSIHVNTFDSDTSVSGLETWYCGDVRDSEQLARLVQNGAVGAAGAKDRGLKETDELIVIRDSAMPSCLIETGFLTNKAERTSLVSKDYQDKLAEGMAQGIDEFLRLRRENEENGKTDLKTPAY